MRVLAAIACLLGVRAVSGKSIEGLPQSSCAVELEGTASNIKVLALEGEFAVVGGVERLFFYRLGETGWSLEAKHRIEFNYERGVLRSRVLALQVSGRNETKVMFEATGCGHLHCGSWSTAASVEGNLVDLRFVDAGHRRLLTSDRGSSCSGVCLREYVVKVPGADASSANDGVPLLERFTVLPAQAGLIAAGERVVAFSNSTNRVQEGFDIIVRSKDATNGAADIVLPVDALPLPYALAQLAVAAGDTVVARYVSLVSETGDDLVDRSVVKIFQRPNSSAPYSATTLYQGPPAYELNMASDGNNTLAFARARYPANSFVDMLEYDGTTWANTTTFPTHSTLREGHFSVDSGRVVWLIRDPSGHVLGAYPDNCKSLSTPLVVGIAVGSVVASMLVVWYIIRRRSARAQRATNLKQVAVINPAAA